MSASWPAPAKLNLFLHITGRRPDGYHELQTVFQFLDFGDGLGFSLREDGDVRRVGDVPGVPEADDLAVRAAKILQSAARTRLGCEIRIEKRIPVGGGLGGGSSDAATTLVALNHLWGAGLPEERLSRLALELGADVPVFVHGHATWAEGVGEILTPVSPPESWFLVVTPPVAVSTRDIFNAPELPRSSPLVTPADFEAGAVRNDCVETVRARYPEVGRALDWLAARGPARMSGTGSSVFAAFDSEQGALAARDDVPPEWSGFVARGLNVSPLRVALESVRVT